MNYPIKTNKVIAKFDFDAIDAKYDIFRVTTTEQYIKDGALVLDSPVATPNVCSLQFTKGRDFHVLMKHDVRNLSLLKSVLDTTEKGTTLTIEQQKSNTIPTDIMLQLLLNSLNNSDSKYLCFNNLTGHLYCFNPELLKRSRKNDMDTIMKVQCLELKVTQDLCLQNYVRTFSSIILKNKITFGKRKFNEYPQYVMSEYNTLRRKLKDEKVDNAFIQRQVDSDRSEIPFLNIQDIASFKKSKMGIVADVFERFNSKFNGYASITFETIEEYTSLDFEKNISKNKKATIESILIHTPINLIDCIKDEFSQVYCQRFIQNFKSMFNTPISIGKRILKNKLNIRLVHNKEYYEGEKDPYTANNTEAAVQHITFEDFGDDCSAAITTIVQELLIKYDLVNSRISMVDWLSYGFPEKWVFGIKSTSADSNEYIFLTIFPDGEFKIKTLVFDLFSIDEYQKYITIFEDNAKTTEGVKGVIVNHKNQINIIRETSWYSIPEISSISEHLQADNTYLRGKEKRNELLSACLDIKYIKSPNEAYFFVGTIGNGMRQVVNRACNIRKVEDYKGSPIFFDSMLPLMNVDFVRNGQLTIMPFPFKYLREYNSV